MMAGEGSESPQKVVISKPVSFEADSAVDNKPPNVFQRVLSLFKHVRPGTDLTSFQLPPIFNIPKSQLQCYGESVYCTKTDLLSRCNHAESSKERFLCVLSWWISVMRPVDFGEVPYNSILGETHHVSRGSLNVLLEQVSHHPPVSALHATDEKENIELIWCQHPVPKFNGAAVNIEVRGNRQLRLLNHGETYSMKSPNLSFRFLPVPATEWVGTVMVQCQETGYQAEICYKSASIFASRGTHRKIEGKIFDSTRSKPLYQIGGHWDKTITLKDNQSGEVSILYSAKEVLYGLKTPIVKNIQDVWASESTIVWGKVSQAILSKDWEKAREAKDVVEEKQRNLLKERKSMGETWVPKHFVVSQSEGGWEISPVEKCVPPASIVVPQ